MDDVLGCEGAAARMHGKAQGVLDYMIQETVHGHARKLIGRVGLCEENDSAIFC